jgi:hypothetical protein
MIITVHIGKKRRLQMAFDEQWFDRGIEEGARYLIVACDTFSYDDYPVFVKENENFYKKYDELDGKNMQKIMEVYDLKMDKETQLNEQRAHHQPLRR